jgi:hypothetical protein
MCFPKFDRERLPVSNLVWSVLCLCVQVKLILTITWANTFGESIATQEVANAMNERKNENFMTCKRELF